MSDCAFRQQKKNWIKWGDSMILEAQIGKLQPSFVERAVEIIVHSMRLLCPQKVVGLIYK